MTVSGFKKRQRRSLRYCRKRNNWTRVLLRKGEVNKERGMKLPARSSFSSQSPPQRCWRVFDSTSLQCDSSRAQRRDVRALLSLHGHTKNTSIEILWPRFNMFGGFLLCIYSKNVICVDWVRSFTNKEFPLACDLFLNKVHLWPAHTY